MCEIAKERHICQKQCYLYTCSRECNKACSQPYGHSGNCICTKNKNQHKCNERCSLINGKGCTTICVKEYGHSGNHNCSIREDQHKCDRRCKFSGNTNAKCCVNEFCQERYGHSGDEHLCQRSYHFCSFPCGLRSILGCQGICKELYGIPHQHKCLERHICKEECYFYKDFKTNPEKCINCRKKCCLPYQHQGNCICIEENRKEIHPCDGLCSLKEAGGCARTCNLIYKHSPPCQCIFDKKSHTCQKKCELCKNTTVCGHVFNHENDRSLQCSKCHNGICQLKSGDGHLCGSIHYDGNYCKKPGLCKNDPLLEGEGEDATYQSKLGQSIDYKKFNIGINEPEKCRIEIPPNKMKHEGPCDCRNAHFCNFQCQQCLVYCIEYYAPSHSLHFCTHGNIKKSYIYISDKKENSYANVIKDNKKYKLIEGEGAEIFLCDQYCREQGQGHTHLFESEDKIDEYNNEQIKLVEEKDNKYIYESKCPYFWENILKFNSKHSQEDKKKFNLCNWKCKDNTHQIAEYCQLQLWHQPTDHIPSGIYGKSVYDGHVFKCSHPRGAFNIFLIDCSGSMKSQSVKPNYPKIEDKMPNMLGAAIQEIYRYCKTRAVESFKDKCAIFGYSNEASKVFTERKIDEEQCETILDDCLGILKPNGGTKFLPAFEKAFDLIAEKEINKSELTPVIILLTDGLDHNHKETLSYIEKVSILFYLFFYRR